MKRDPPARPSGRPSRPGAAAEPAALRDSAFDAGDDADRVLAGRLLRSSRPYQASAAERQRVWARLATPPRRPARVGRLRPALATLLLLGAAAAASATIGRRLLVRALEPATSTAAPTVPPRRSAAHAAPAPPAPPPGTVAPPQLGPTSPASAAPPAIVVAGGLPSKNQPSAAAGPGLLTPPGTKPAMKVMRAEPHPPRAAAPAAPGAVAPLPEAMVWSAQVALEQDRDPARALSLLDRYLASHPGRALAEEARWLSVEAAERLGDPRAASFCERYLAHHPEGRFAPQARAAAERLRAR